MFSFIFACGCLFQNSNQITLDSYEKGYTLYAQNTPTELSENIKQWVDETLSFLAPNAAILEIGSGFGRDAAYIETKGFQVQRTDAVLGFVDSLQAQGHPAFSFNLLTDPFPQSYDLIFANAVFLHFNPQELETSLKTTLELIAEEHGVSIIKQDIKIA